MKFTKFEIAEYILGWLDVDREWFDENDIESILHNAKAMLTDEQDGIEAAIRRRIQNRKE
jgi:hypothetical protein